MKKYLASLAVFLFAGQVWAADIVDFQIKSVTNLVTTSHARTTSGTIGDFGSYYRFHCTALCSVAVSNTDFQGTFGIVNAATNYIMIPAAGIAYIKATGKNYIIGYSDAANTLTISEMSP
jgi:hypothetical protein